MYLLIYFTNDFIFNVFTNVLICNNFLLMANRTYLLTYLAENVIIIVVIIAITITSYYNMYSACYVLSSTFLNILGYTFFLHFASIIFMRADGHTQLLF